MISLGRHISSWLFAILIMFMIVACSHKDILCPGDEPHGIEVRFEWDKAPSASPDGMTLYFFADMGKGRIWRFDISGRDGGSIELPVGQYHMLAFNNDRPDIIFTGTESYSAFKASLRSDGDYYRSGGMLYGAKVDYVEVTPCGVTYLSDEGHIKNCNKGLIRCFPDSLTTMYTVIVKNIEGIERVKTAYARLNGIASELLLESNTPVNFPSDLMFKLSVQKDRQMFSGTAGAFAPGDRHKSYSLDIIVTRTDGKTFSKKFDVSNQVLNSPYRRTVIVTIDSISIPEGDIPDNPGDDVGGIEVGVEGWNIIEIDLSTDINI